MKSPKTLSISVNVELRASHSLAGFETPHFHLWKIEAEFKTNLPMKTDRVIDLVLLKTKLDEILSPYQGKHLNTELDFSPTSENLGLWLWNELAKKFKDEPLHQIVVKLCDLEGRVSGTARIEA